MVRLVFRPYTRVRRSICTLESLRPSTRVSPGFGLLGHSSPSFGSRHICSHSNLSSEESWSVDGAKKIPPKISDILYVNSALGGELRALAHMSDSLVRVSRRDDERHFVKVSPSHDGIMPFPHKEESLTCPAPLNGTRPTLPPIDSFSAISGTL